MKSKSQMLGGLKSPAARRYSTLALGGVAIIAKLLLLYGVLKLVG